MRITLYDWEDPIAKSYFSTIGSSLGWRDYCQFFPEHRELREIAKLVADFIGPAPTVFLEETEVWPSSRKHELEKIVTDQCPELGGLTDGHVIEFEDSPRELVVDFLHFALGSVHALLIESQDMRRTVVSTDEEFIFARAAAGDMEGQERLQALMTALKKVKAAQNGI